MSKPTAEKRRHRSDGLRTHTAILDAATRLASVEGVHGLTFGRLAEVLDVSKSGLYSHFGSKEQLQRETIETAQAIFQREVFSPVLEAPDGLARLERLIQVYFSYVERWVFPGGCFFAALLAEADARADAIHDLVVGIEREWAEALSGFVRSAQGNGEIAADADVSQLVFELNAVLEMANYQFVLFRDPEILELGRRAAAGVLRRHRTA
jgi:AcrR family transcriptional regulator